MSPSSTFTLLSLPLSSEPSAMFSEKGSTFPGPATSSGTCCFNETAAGEFAFFERAVISLTEMVSAITAAMLTTTTFLFTTHSNYSSAQVARDGKRLRQHFGGNLRLRRLRLCDQ